MKIRYIYIEKETFHIIVILKKKKITDVTAMNNSKSEIHLIFVNDQMHPL